jgi:hypothetical protein
MLVERLGINRTYFVAVSDGSDGRWGDSIKRKRKKKGFKALNISLLIQGEIDVSG